MTGQELKEWRNRVGYSQSHLAQLLGVVLNTVSLWETGHRKPPPFLPLALAHLEQNQGDPTNGHRGMKERGETVTLVTKGGMKGRSFSWSFAAG